MNRARYESERTMLQMTVSNGYDIKRAQWMEPAVSYNARNTILDRNGICRPIGWNYPALPFGILANYRQRAEDIGSSQYPLRFRQTERISWALKF